MADIEDMMVDGQEFSDGCGLMSKALAVYVSKSKKIIFRGKRYTPCVYQIRFAQFFQLSNLAYIMSVDIWDTKVYL